MVAEKPALTRRILPTLARGRGYYAAFLLSALTAALFILPYTIGQDGFYIGSDYVHQQVPYWTFANSAVKTGDVLWSDTLDLGTAFVPGFSFSPIGSVFFWLSLLFPANGFYLLAPWMLIFKLGVCGLAAYCWLRQYTKTDTSALVGSLLYAFCGFQISNLNFNSFADALALFPFMLLALDQAVLRGRRFWFAITVALCALCNWFLFFGQAVFLVIYYVVKTATREYPRLTGRLFGRMAAESAIGVGLSAVLWLPSVLMVGASPRADAAFESVWRMLVPKPIYIAEWVRGLLLPAESNFSRGFFLEVFFNGGELYLPLFGIVLAMAWVLNRRKSFEAVMLAVCAVFLLVPVLNSVFVALNAEYYTRWYFMPTLVMCLATARTLDTPEIPLKRGVISYLGLWGVFGLIAAWFILYYQVTFVYNLVPAAVYVFTSLAGFGITLFTRRIQKKRWGAAALLALVMLFAASTGLHNIYRMHKTWDDSGPKTLYTAPKTLDLPQSETYYRIDADGYHFYNLGVMAGYPSMESFSSTIAPSIFGFYDLLGIPRTVISNLPEADYGYRAFLSARYWVRYGAGTGADGVPGWEHYTTQGNFNVYESEWYIPLGFTYNEIMTETQFRALPQETKHWALVRALVVTEEQAAAFGEMMQPVPPDVLESLSAEGFEADVAARRQTTAGYSAKTNTGYEIGITLQQENIVFLSIPWDAGWSAEVNGRPTEIHKVSGGFMGIACPAGENEITLHYMPPGLVAGLWMSIVALAALLGWFSTNRCRKQKYLRNK